MERKLIAQRCRPSCAGVTTAAACYLQPMQPAPTALVTGATEGIGRATAFALGHAGYRVAVCARTASKLDALVSELRAAGIEAAGRPGDVGVAADAEAVVREAERALGPVDVLINNAGLLVGKRIEELTLDEWDATMATNVRPLFLFTRRV